MAPPICLLRTRPGRRSSSAFHGQPSWPGQTRGSRSSPQWGGDQSIAAQRRGAETAVDTAGGTSSEAGRLPWRPAASGGWRWPCAGGQAPPGPPGWRRWLGRGDAVGGHGPGTAPLRARPARGEPSRASATAGAVGSQQPGGGPRRHASPWALGPRSLVLTTVISTLEASIRAGGRVLSWNGRSRPSACSCFRAHGSSCNPLKPHIQTRSRSPSGGCPVRCRPCIACATTRCSRHPQPAT